MSAETSATLKFLALMAAAVGALTIGRYAHHGGQISDGLAGWIDGVCQTVVLFSWKVTQPHETQKAPAA